jgi:PAS domain S-box-containing protein
LLKMTCENPSQNRNGAVTCLLYSWHIMVYARGAAYVQGSDMSVNFNSWLRQHETDVEARWLEAVRHLRAYDAFSPHERLSCWQPLIEALLTDRIEALEEKALHWADREAREHGAAPSELLTIASGLSQAIRDLLPAEGMHEGRDGYLRRFNSLGEALARHFAEDAERLAAEKSQLETLYEIARELAASLDLDRMLHRTLAEVTTALAAEMGAVFLLDSQAEEVVPETTTNWSGGGMPLEVFPSTWQLGQPDELVALSDVQAESTEAWVDMLVDSDIHSLMAAPLVANGAFLGFLAVASQRCGAFDDAHERLFRAVLSQIATAIGNAEVYRLLTQQAREMGQMLRQQQEESSKSQAILTSIADGVVVNDAEGQTILVNPAAEHVLEKPRGQLIGQDFHALFSVFDADGRREAVAAMETLLAISASELRQDFQMMLEAETRVIQAHLSPVIARRGDSLGVVTILRDITKEVEADRAKNEFVSNVSHELRTPMTAIKGYTDLLYAGSVGPINQEQKRFVKIIKNNAERLTALINDLLDISRVETGRVRFEPRPMQVGDVIAEVVNALAGQAEAKDQTLAYEIVGGLPDVMGDRNRLNQVVTNLVGNAIRYTPPGGEIEVRTYRVEGAVRVDVRDTGIGIAAEDLGHLFERFYRAEHPVVQEIGGTGLGLAIVKMFVEMHGGRVWVDSELGEGSTFTFILPVPAQAEEEGEVRQVPPGLMARTRTILVVDDDPDAAELIEMHLEDAGYQVFVLRGGRSVVAWSEEMRPDLIVLDLILPDIDGMEVLRALKENAVTVDIPVVVLTIKQDDGRARRLGAVDYVNKPVEKVDFLRVVKRALTWQGRVLIVEDDVDTGDFISEAVRQIGFTPLLASNGYEALALARRFRPDLVFLDLRLPGMDGYEALTHLKRDAVTQTIPIVAISAHVTDAEQEQKRLVALGATSFLPKPFSVKDLMREVEEALRPVFGSTSLQ